MCTYALALALALLTPKKLWLSLFALKFRCVFRGRECAVAGGMPRATIAKLHTAVPKKRTAYEKLFGLFAGSPMGSASDDNQRISGGASVSGPSALTKPAASAREVVTGASGTNPAGEVDAGGVGSPGKLNALDFFASKARFAQISPRKVRSPAMLTRSIVKGK
jgi:hypothetical protein